MTVSSRLSALSLTAIAAATSLLPLNKANAGTPGTTPEHKVYVGLMNEDASPNPYVGVAVVTLAKLAVGETAFPDTLSASAKQGALFGGDIFVSLYSNDGPRTYSFSTSGSISDFAGKIVGVRGFTNNDVNTTPENRTCLEFKPNQPSNYCAVVGGGGCGIQASTSAPAVPITFQQNFSPSDEAALKTHLGITGDLDFAASANVPVSSLNVKARLRYVAADSKVYLDLDTNGNNSLGDAGDKAYLAPESNSETHILTLYNPEASVSAPEIVTLGSAVNRINFDTSGVNSTSPVFTLHFNPPADVKNFDLYGAPSEEFTHAQTDLKPAGSSTEATHMSGEAK